MATAGFGFAETYVTVKHYKEKMKKRAQEEEGEESSDMNISSMKTSSGNKTSIGCFSWVSKQHHRKNSRISDYNHTEAAS